MFGITKSLSQHNVHTILLQQTIKLLCYQDDLASMWGGRDAAISMAIETKAEYKNHLTQFQREPCRAGKGIQVFRPWLVISSCKL